MNKCPHCGGTVVTLVCKNCGNRHLVTKYDTCSSSIVVGCDKCNREVLRIANVDIPGLAIEPHTESMPSC